MQHLFSADLWMRMNRLQWFLSLKPDPKNNVSVCELMKSAAPTLLEKRGKNKFYYMKQDRTPTWIISRVRNLNLYIRVLIPKLLPFEV